MRSKRHHYLPQFYLEYFLPEDGSGTFWVYDKAGGEPRPQTPVNTCVEGHLYSFADPKGGKTDELERELFSRLDGQTKPVLDRWRDTRGEVSPGDVPVLAEFVAALHTRVPRHIESTRQMLLAVLSSRRRFLLEHPAELASLVESFKRDRPGYETLQVEELRQLFQDFDKRFVAKPSPDQVLAFSLAATAVVYEELMTMRWQLLNVKANNPLVTSDAPVVVFVPCGKDRAMFGAGIALPAAEVVFPVSPDVCLYIDHGLSGDRRTAHDSFVREMNRRIIYNAERFVISRTNDPSLAELVTLFSRTRGRQRIDADKVHKRIKWPSLRKTPRDTGGP